jgi:hypothetical protein
MADKHQALIPHGPELDPLVLARWTGGLVISMIMKN